MECDGCGRVLGVNEWDISIDKEGVFCQECLRNEGSYEEVT